MEDQAPTSLFIASCDEIRKALEQGFVFPAIAIPFGAETDSTVPCRHFNTATDLTTNELERLLASAYPMPNGERKIHLISRPVVVIGFAGFQSNGLDFYLVNS